MGHEYIINWEQGQGAMLWGSLIFVFSVGANLHAYSDLKNLSQDLSSNSNINPSRDGGGKP